jgi:hypothetical protein
MRIRLIAHRAVNARFRRVCARAAAMLLLASPSHAEASKAAPTIESGPCGERIALRTHDDSTTYYALAGPTGKGPNGPPTALLLLPGGAGLTDLDESGCARQLKGNFLVNSIPLFRATGFFTVLVDAPSDQQGPDGLGGFRIDPRHADDLGKVVADVRRRTKAAVWLVGTSRGSISAANAASATNRLRGDSVADGLVLSSSVSTGQAGARKSFVAQTVFDLPLEAIRMPTLIVGHADDTCVRSPASRLKEIGTRINAARKQVVTVTGGPGNSGVSEATACEGRAPHGFVGQREEVVIGIARFVRGGVY